MRCAIYARVSVADAERPGLTSIQVQVEACEQYIAARRGMGWIQSGPAYIDDGVSASTLQRPGLRALLTDIRQDKIGVVVVHRLDRLSRSLFDLSDLLPLFAVQGVELVSVTQSIDTHTPNGRLSLNLLTSFAEFEREIIGERTRDKLAATRRQGRWQGNGTPLGYAVDHEQRLVVVPPEAELVKDIFRRYLALDTMAELMAWIGRRGIKTKRWITCGGKARGGQPLDRTTVYRMLNNRMYIGEALFHDEWHSGIYPPIIDLDLWREVQDKLARRARRKGVANKGRDPVKFPLLGKLFWHTGDAYTAFESDKRGSKRYRYYLAPAAAKCESVADIESFNLSAEDIHRVVENHLREQFRVPDGLLPALLEHTCGLDEDTARQALRELDAVWNRFADIGLTGSINSLISRVTIYPDRAGIRIDLPALAREVEGMTSRKQPTQEGHARGHPAKATATSGKPTTQLPNT
jgi:DNA invertase Pin-like site-specific DNA recombinase